MSNVIPIRPDPFRTLFETIDQYNDTDQSPEQKRITDEALALVQKMIEAKHGDSERRPTPA